MNEKLPVSTPVQPDITMLGTGRPRHQPAVPRALHAREGLMLYISNASATSTEPPDASIGQPFALVAASS